MNRIYLRNNVANTLLSKKNEKVAKKRRIRRKRRLSDKKVDTVVKMRAMTEDKGQTTTFLNPAQSSDPIRAQRKKTMIVR